MGRQAGWHVCACACGWVGGWQVGREAGVGGGGMDVEMSSVESAYFIPPNPGP